MEIYTLVGKMQFSFIGTRVIGCFSTTEAAERAKAEYIAALENRSDLLKFDSYDVEQYSLDSI
jgi:hypothetical protein